jgi:hypothetical protein
MSTAMSLGAEMPIVKAVLGKNVVIQRQIRRREDLNDRNATTLSHDPHPYKVRANVKVREIEVRGWIQSKIEAVDKVYIRKNAQLVGDVRSAAVIIEDGAGT